MASVGTCSGNSHFPRLAPHLGLPVPFSMPAFIITLPYCPSEHRRPQARLPPQPKEGSITHTSTILQTPTVCWVLLRDGGTG